MKRSNKSSQFSKMETATPKWKSKTSSLMSMDSEILTPKTMILFNIYEITHFLFFPLLYCQNRYNYQAIGFY